MSGREVGNDSALTKNGFDCQKPTALSQKRWEWGKKSWLAGDALLLSTKIPAALGAAGRDQEDSLQQKNQCCGEKSRALRATTAQQSENAESTEQSCGGFGHSGDPEVIDVCNRVICVETNELIVCIKVQTSEGASQ